MSGFQSCSMNELTVHRQGSDTVEVPFHWRSNWVYEAGITRSWENGWHASVGYIYAENVVPDEGLTEALTHDHPFEQAGFTVVFAD